MASNVIATSFTTTNYGLKNLDRAKVAKFESNAFGTPMINYPVKKSERAKGALAVSSKASGAFVSAPGYISKKGKAIVDGVQQVPILSYITSGHILNGLSLPIVYPDSHPIHHHDWHDHVVDQYPWWIGADGLAEFKHVSRQFFNEGSTAAVVYRVTNDAGKEYDWLFAWDNPYDENQEPASLHAYTEIHEADQVNDWNVIRAKLAAASSTTSF